jgi:hypothetical protein
LDTFAKAIPQIHATKNSPRLTGRGALEPLTADDRGALYGVAVLPG